MGRPVRVALALISLTAVAVAAAAVPILRPSGSDPTTAPLPDAAVEVERDPSGAVRSLGTEPGTPIELSATEPEAAADEFVDRYGPALAGSATDLTAIGTEPRVDGGVAVRYQQVVDGIPVLGAEVSVQVDDDGGVLSSLADLSPGADALSVPEATISAAAARREAVIATARETGAEPAALSATAPEQWIYDPAVIGPPAGAAPRLTWRIEVSSEEHAVDQLVLIDAARGGTVLSFSQLAGGLERKVCDAVNQRQSQPCTAPYARVEGQPAVPSGGGAGEVNTAYDYSGATYDFFHTRFDRDGIDGDGGAIRTKVRYCSTDLATGCPYANAFWSPSFDQATFGQGYAKADDVVAHELTHGITAETANLFFYYQSGAINESLSDIFGEFVDQTDGLGKDGAKFRWRIGEELPGGALRNMANPTASPYLDPDRMTSGLYAADSGGTDAGGVHTNSGVGNRTAALLTAGGSFNGQTVTGIGIDKAAAIYYETLTAMLTSASDYADLAAALPQACDNLVGTTAGITSGDCTQVDRAVLATEMASAPTTLGAAAPEAPVCAGDLQPTPLFADDFEDDPAARWAFDTVDIPGVSPDNRWAFQHEVGIEYQTDPDGTDGLWGGDFGTTADRRVRMTEPVLLPEGSTPFLHFRHAYGFESSGGSNYDGGVVEYSTEGAAGPWLDLGPRFVGADANGYNGPLASGGTNPLAGQSAFVGSSHGYVSSRADLGPLAGESLLLRFRLGEDEEVETAYGWFVDDVRVYTCDPPAPAVQAELSADETMVTVGDPIHLHSSLHNNSNVDLSNVVVSVAGCSEPIGTLAVGATEVVDCDHITSDPDDLGQWSATTSVTADELDGPTLSNSVEVSVLNPGTAALTLSQSTDQESVDLGQPVTLHLTIRNTGNVAIDLTGAVISTPEAPECQAAALPPSLGVGVETTVDCITTPPGVGTWTSTASIDTGQTDPIFAAPVSVLVLDASPPTIAITQPATDAVFNVGQVVLADYACPDESPGVVACVGTAADGQPVDTATAGPKTFTVTATDAAGNESEVTNTYLVAERRPDGRIRQGATGPMAGDNRSNTTGAGQARSALVARGGQATFFVTVQNDGSLAEPMRVRGQPGTTNYAVRYFSGGQDITALVRNGSYVTPPLAVGAVRTIKVVVTVGAGAPAGSQVERLVTISSTNDPSRKDVVRFIVRRR